MAVVFCAFLMTIVNSVGNYFFSLIIQILQNQTGSVPTSIYKTVEILQTLHPTLYFLVIKVKKMH
jgi:hypothetical protein